MIKILREEIKNEMVSLNEVSQTFSLADMQDEARMCRKEIIELGTWFSKFEKS